MRVKTKVYAAALIDSEGCLSLQKHNRPRYPHYQLMICVATTNQPLAKWWVKHFGGTWKKKEFADPKRRTQYDWRLYGNTALRFFLESVSPYLVVKKTQARIALEFLDLDGEYSPEKRETLFLKMRELKHAVSVETDTPDPLGKEGRTYYAGFFDGEGSVNITRNPKNGKYHRYISATNVYKPVLDALCQVYGGCVIEKKDDYRKMPCFSWYLSGKAAIERFLLWSLPYFVIKREEAKVLLEEVRLPNGPNRALRDEIYQKFKSVQDHPRGKTQSKLSGDVESEPAETQDILNTQA